MSSSLVPAIAYSIINKLENKITKPFMNYDKT